MYSEKLAAYERAVEALKCFTEALKILANVPLSQGEVDIISERIKWLMDNERHARLALIEFVLPKGAQSQGI